MTNVVIGIGVNVLHAPEGVPYPATSLAACGADVTAEALFQALAEAWVEQEALWDDGNGFAAIREPLARARRRPRRADRGRASATRWCAARSRRSTTMAGWSCGSADGSSRTISGRRSAFRRSGDGGAVTMQRSDELVFVPLGGVGEIGMNLALYGYGHGRNRAWLAVDMGVAFGHEDLPGVDAVLPDIRYLLERKDELVGIVISHAHEDHYGALIDFWPQLEAPVYMTPFAAGAARGEARRRAERAENPGHDRAASARPFTVGPFEVEYIPVSHSIPEPNALAIRTPLGTVLHTGDWKLDPAPGIGLADRRRPPRGARRRKACSRSSPIPPTPSARASARAKARSRRCWSASSPRRRTASPSPHSPPTSRA